MTHLKEGDKAPESLFNKEYLKSIDIKGKKIILYFYPKDNTPGCTTEACNLRDHYKLLKSKGFEVIGVSPDSEKSHEKFIQKFDLPFPLIPDTEKELVAAFGAYGEKKMYGKTFKGVNRMTFIISEEGIIEKIITTVKTKEHASQILKQMGLL